MKAYLFLLNESWKFLRGYKDMFSQAWEFARGHRLIFISVFVFGIINMGAALMKPYFNGKFFNAIQIGGENMWVNIFIFVGILSVLHFIHVFLWYWANYNAEKSSLEIKKNAILHFYKKLYNLPINFHTNHHSGDTLSRIRQSADGISKFPLRQPSVIKYVMRFFGPLILLCLFSWKIALLTLGISTIILIGMTVSDHRRIKFMKQTNHLGHSFNSALMDSVTNIKTVKIFGLYDKMIKGLVAKFIPIKEKDLQLGKIDKYKWSFFDIGVFILTNGVVLFYVWLLWRQGGIILIGSVFAVHQYVKDVQEFFLGYGHEYQAMLQMKTDYEEIAPILNTEQSHKRTAKIKPFKNLQINNLSFTYPEKKNPQLDNASITINKGKKIAFVGESGSGKSTMLAIMKGLLDDYSANIIINGERADLSAISDLITFVPQDPEIFEESILYNITFGGHVQKRDIDEAVKIARFDDVLKRTKKTLADDAKEKGLNLSGGEKQRLALARGILAMKNSEIILLDEPTSSIDVQNETMIYNRIFAKFHGRTIVSTVHKLNVINMFDYIYVFKNGKIAEHGTVKQLTTHNGIFTGMMKKYKSDNK